MPIVEPARLFFEVLTNFCRDLTIGHLVDCLSADDASAQTFVRETLFEFPFASPGPKSRIDSASRICEITSS
jgi:hypothetical protein